MQCVQIMFLLFKYWKKKKNGKGVVGGNIMQEEEKVIFTLIFYQAREKNLCLYAKRYIGYPAWLGCGINM